MPARVARGIVVSCCVLTSISNIPHLFFVYHHLLSHLLFLFIISFVHIPLLIRHLLLVLHPLLTLLCSPPYLPLLLAHHHLLLTTFLFIITTPLSIIIFGTIMLEVCVLHPQVRGRSLLVSFFESS